MPIIRSWKEKGKGIILVQHRVIDNIGKWYE